MGIPMGDAATGNVIATAGLTKTFGDTAALEDLHLEVPAGSIFGYLGPNGAGKSTTMRLLMGLIRPTSGTATVLGLDVVAEREEVQRRVGYLPGEFTAYRDLTGDQYLKFFASLRGGGHADAYELLAERFDLDLTRPMGTLSHGNRQKVGIVAAFMAEPELLVLDEPTQGLDPLVAHEFLELLREQRDAGRTVLLSSHVLSEVEEVADTVAIIRSGRLLHVAQIADLKVRARRRVELIFGATAAPPADELRAVHNVVELTVTGSVVELVVEGSMAELLRVSAPHGIERVVSAELDLEGVFMRYYEQEG